MLKNQQTLSTGLSSWRFWQRCWTAPKLVRCTMAFRLGCCQWLWHASDIFRQRHQDKSVVLRSHHDRWTSGSPTRAHWTHGSMASSWIEVLWAVVACRFCLRLKVENIKICENFNKITKDHALGNIGRHPLQVGQFDRCHGLLINCAFDMFQLHHGKVGCLANESKWIVVSIVLVVYH